jgi:hypothetical protein
VNCEGLHLISPMREESCGLNVALKDIQRTQILLGSLLTWSQDVDRALRGPKSLLLWRMRLACHRHLKYVPSVPKGTVAVEEISITFEAEIRWCQRGSSLKQEHLKMACAKSRHPE